MTIVAVLQPSYLPWLGYFDQIALADVFVSLDNVQYTHHDWRNRNRVKGPEGPLWLTVPVKKAGNFGQSILDAQVDYQRNWPLKHLRTLRQMYARAPYLDTCIDGINDILEARLPQLVDINLALQEYLCRQLKIDTVLRRSSELGIDPDPFAIDPSARILGICTALDASVYLSGASARNYLNTSLFEKAGIEVKWQDYQHPEYRQQHGDFVKNLSIVDLIFNEGPHSIQVLRQGRTS